MYGMGSGRFTGAVVMIAMMTILSSCDRSSGQGGAVPPRAKPAVIPVRLEGPTPDTSVLGSVSTRKGELTILENDGSVSKAKIGSARARSTVRQSDDSKLSLSDVLVEDTSIPLEALPKAPTAQEIAIKEFSARRRSALPSRIVKIPQDGFMSARIRKIQQAGRKEDSNLVSVVVQFKSGLGVDEPTAFAYATCTLAQWSRKTNTPYARHVRTIMGRSDGTTVAESIYTMSTTVPLGLNVMERGPTLRRCRASGIPVRTITAGAVEGKETNG